jgi:antitoxin (DNA-binding transcriptional repressor) of toxin-antitoxin stability system
MEALKVGIREFRSQLPHYLLEAGQPVAITRHGETIGYYIPSRETEPIADIAALKAVAAKLDALLKSAQVDPEVVVADFTARRRKK